MRCNEAYRFICDNLDQSVDSPECRAIRRHLEECPDCRLYLDSLKKTVTLYRLEPGARKVPPGVHDRLMKMINVNVASHARPKKGRTASHK